MTSDRYLTKPEPVRAFFYDGIDPYPVIRWFAEEFDICWTVKPSRLHCDQLGTFWPRDEPTWFVHAGHLGIQVYTPEAFAKKFERAPKCQQDGSRPTG